MITLVFNFVVFQAAWFITIFSAAAGAPLYGPVFTLLWMLVHLGLFTEKRLAEVNILLYAAILGYALDSLMVSLSVFSFPPQTMLGSPSPLWMIALWINLAATLNISLRWLRGRYVLAALLGAIGGPMAYFGGSKLGAMALLEPWSLLVVSLQWMVAMPLLVLFAQWQAAPVEPQFLAGETEGE